MTDYAGELYRVTVTAEDFANVPIGEDEIDSMLVEIFDSAGTEVVAETAMIWSEDEELWYYLWDTGDPTLATGTYKIRCRMLDLDGHSSWEWKRKRLARNLVES